MSHDFVLRGRNFLPSQLQLIKISKWPIFSFLLFFFFMCLSEPSEPNLQGRVNYFLTYSSNKIRMTQNEHLIIFWQNLIGLDIWEKSISILEGNLNSGLGYLITTVKETLRLKTCSIEKPFLSACPSAPRFSSLPTAPGYVWKISGVRFLVW